MTLFALPDLPAGDTDDESYEGDLGVDSASEAQARSSMAGREFDELTNEFLERSGATIVERYPRVFGYRLDALVEGRTGPGSTCSPMGPLTARTEPRPVFVVLTRC